MWISHMDTYIWASQVAQWKWNRLQSRKETQVPSLGQEDPLEKEMALQYSCLENPLDRGAWQATVHGVIRVRHNLATESPANSMHMSPPSWDPFPPGLSCASWAAQQLPASQLLYTLGSLLSMLLPQLASSSPSPLRAHVHSLRLGLYCCPADRLLCAMFLDSTHIHSCTVFFFFSFWLTSFCILIRPLACRCHLTFIM